LIIVDDVGLLPVSADAGESLFRVVDGAYEKRSLAISSDIHPTGFDEADAQDPRDRGGRLLHYAHVLITDGTDSYRLSQATAGKGGEAPHLRRP
jgi:DNA replication protein DnaC